MSDAGYPLAGKVAYMTGAARGQGRSHCVRLARAGGFAFVDLQDVTSTQTGARLRSEQQTVSRPVRGESEVALARDVTAVPAISTTNLITRPATRMVP
jgi:NAD(P)-dependent dehydrogenase (short-subunit alcohol dehydrogenase family)